MFGAYMKRTRQSCRHSRFTHRVLSKLRMTSKPKLKSKARAALHVNAWLLDTLKQDTSTPHKRARASLVWGYDSMFEVCSNAGVFFTDVELSNCCVAATTIINATRFLHQESLRLKTNRWHVIPKAHHLIELKFFCRRTMLNAAGAYYLISISITKRNYLYIYYIYIYIYTYVCACCVRAFQVS